MCVVFFFASKQLHFIACFNSSSIFFLIRFDCVVRSRVIIKNERNNTNDHFFLRNLEHINGEKNLSNLLFCIIAKAWVKYTWFYYSFCHFQSPKVNWRNIAEPFIERISASSKIFAFIPLSIRNYDLFQSNSVFGKLKWLKPHSIHQNVIVSSSTEMTEF